jgi:type I restriction enzyme, R subunit
MTPQPEQILEDNLIKQLSGLSYKIVSVNNERDLLANLKSQLEKHNKTSFSDTEFKKILNHLSKGNVFEKAKLLRDKFRLSRDNGESSYIEFIQQEQWCKNQFQVTHQVTMEGKYKNRYDVTILINGFPLVHIELKRRGIELKEAFNQINRYQRHTFGSSFGLYQYAQVFVISNGENTKYYANNRHQSFKQTFYWSDIENRIISQLESFAKEFLEPCHLSKMITKYVVLNETNKVLMVLRPYQYYATEAIIERVKNSHKNGYIWHTTGSGKTLTSFKASQVLIQIPKVHKVVFVVDRRDLDYQTINEFNSFSKGSVDGTDNTRSLVKQFNDTTKLIVTTLQKLNVAITKNRFLSKMEDLKDKRIIFIFDECHRSQFGDTHKRIKAFFQNNQMFGFTGTPIFDVNALSKASIKHTTGELFEECLHKYVITDAIRDENVLKFSIEYIGRYKEKENSNTNLDIKVEDIDTKELFESPQRLEKITDYIIANHNRKTHNREFISLFCVNSIETLIKYYDLFKAKKAEGKHDLKIASIFSYTSNEEDSEADGMIYDDNSLSMPTDSNVDYNTNTHSREKLDAIIEDYNQMYGTRFSTKDSDSFYNYFKDIAKRAKDYEKKHFDVNDRVDIILVVQMLLTGFDATKLNTLYADKNLKHHGLIQAFSRTNRILNEQKSQGNIVCFRNLKEATDDAITLFSNKDAKDIIILKPYEEYVQKFNIAFADLLKIAPTTNSVNDLPSEVEELEFIKAFRNLMRLKNVLSTFVDFDWEDLAMEEQKFENYKSKYLDLYDKVKSSHQKEKVSILDEVDFELELIHRDEINVAYILRLLSRLKKAKEAEREQHKKAIIDILSGEAKLRSKRELIEKFIEENLPHIKDLDDIPAKFESYWKDEQMKAFNTICKEEHIETEKLQHVLNDYLFTERLPLRDDIVNALKHKPKLLERKTITERVIHKIVDFVETFISGMAA